jgi:hypothetical protein
VFEISHADPETNANKHQFGGQPMGYSLQTNLYKVDMLYDHTGNTSTNALNLINAKELDKKNEKQDSQIVQNNIINVNSKRDPLLD